MSDRRAPVSPQDFRQLMASFPSGVTVVTSLTADGEPWGMTCSSLCSVALEPPTLLVSLRAVGPTLHAILGRRAFAVNLLHQGAQGTAQLFASGVANRFDQVRWLLPADGGGPHLPDDAHTVADCRLSGSQSIGDHTVVFGEVIAVQAMSTQPPLLYGMRRYAAWPGSEPAPVDGCARCRADDDNNRDSAAAVGAAAARTGTEPGKHRGENAHV